MERTEMRDAFFDDVKRDPYGHMLAYLYADAWADAYERALGDAAEAVAAECSPDEVNFIGPDGETKYVPQALLDLRKSYADRRHDALEHLTEQKNLAAARLVVALAQIGPLATTRPPEGDHRV